jgi:hypothetical protein
MSYVQKSNAPRSNNYSKPAAPAPQKQQSANAQPTHTLSAKCGEGDAVEFISLTGLFPGESKDGRSMMKGKPRATVIIRTEDGRELTASQFFVMQKDAK